jgi:dihydrolipoamide dehydrogenase
VYDVVVIGGGPGGYVAAIKGAQLGGKIALVEGTKMGGTCLNVGCIPTKALVHSASTYLRVKDSSRFGIEAKEVRLNMKSVMNHKKATVEQLVSGVERLVKGNGVQVFNGWAQVPSPGKVEVTFEDRSKEVLSTKNVVIATGSSSFNLPFMKGKTISSDEILDLTCVPERLAIIGGGVIGIEFACVFSAFGSKVTIIELLPTILPNMDREISQRLSLILRKRGITVSTGTSVTQIREEGSDKVIVARVKDGSAKEFRADLVLSAVGRVPNFGGIDLDGLGVAYDRKGIKVDGHMATNVPGIWAIGDVCGRTLLAHGASAEGIVVMENIFAEPTVMDYTVVPGCVFSIPECSGVGLKEKEAQEKGFQVKTSKFPFSANGKALSMGETDGLVKVVAEATSGKVLGMHVLGAHADDLIHEGAIAIRLGLTAKEVADTIHAHPTLSEAVMEAFHGIAGRPIHLLARQSR